MDLRDFFQAFLISQTPTASGSEDKVCAACQSAKAREVSEVCVESLVVVRKGHDQQKCLNFQTC